MAVIVPLTNAANQQLSVSLPINGGTTQLGLTIRYSDIGQMWMMTVRDTTGNVAADSVAFTTGDAGGANILAPFATALIGSAYIINVSGSPLDYPDDSVLGSDFIMIWDSN